MYSLTQWNKRQNNWNEQMIDYNVLIQNVINKRHDKF